MKSAIIFAAAILLLLAVGAARAQVASNPPYTLDQAVIAGGGGTSADAGNTFSITGTIGQAVTGASGAAPFRVQSGFFAVPPAAPTAAIVGVGGRVLTAQGRGVRGVVVMITDSSGATRTTLSGAGGAFRFADVPAGETYVFRIKAKRYEFAQGVQVLFVSEETENIVFIADF